MAFSLRVVIGILFCLSFILLPTGIAILRNHSRTGGILVWNTVGMLLFGIGWLVALVMALTDGGSSNQTIIIQNVVTQNNDTKKDQA